MKYVISRLLLPVAVLILPSLLLAHGGMPTLAKLENTSTNGNNAAIAYRLHLRVAVPQLQKAIPSLKQLNDASNREQQRLMQQTLSRYFLQHINMQQGQLSCPASMTLRGLETGTQVTRLTVWLDYRCPDKTSVTLRSTLLRETDPDHRLVLHLAKNNNQQIQILTPQQPELVLNQQQSNSFFTMLWHGVEHILSGLDHIFFVLGLLLITAGQRRALLVAVSGFTLAHTLTLLLSATGFLVVSSQLIEPIIAWSIALLGFEVLSGRNQAAAWAVFVGGSGLALASIIGSIAFPLTSATGLLLFSTAYLLWVQKQASSSTNSAGTSYSKIRFLAVPFTFGLFHGLGFSGPLMNMNLEGWSMLWTIAGFNLGVELGQLVILGVVIGVIALVNLLFAVQEATTARVRQSTALGLILVAGYWLVERL